MMKRAILIMALCATTAHAEFITGNKLLSNLDGELHERLYAMGYIVGVFDMGRGIIHCPPSNVTVGQVKDMVHQYLRLVPEMRHYSGDSLVNNVLKGAWPCPKNNGRNL